MEKAQQKLDFFDSLGSPYGGAVTALAVTERALDLSPKG